MYRCQVGLHCLRSQPLVSKERRKLAQKQLYDWEGVVDLVEGAEALKPLDSCSIHPLVGFCYALLAVEANRLVQVGESQVLLVSMRRSMSCWETGVGLWLASGTLWKKDERGHPPGHYVFPECAHMRTLVDTAPRGNARHLNRCIICGWRLVRD